MYKYALILLFLAGCAADGLPKTYITLPGGKKIAAEVARTEAETARGLMYRETLSPDKGMLFVFEEEGPRVFWMKNTFIDLDMIFMDGGKKIKCIGANVPKSTAFTPDKDVATSGCEGAMYVLELAAGAAARNNLKQGDVLTWDLN